MRRHIYSSVVVSLLAAFLLVACTVPDAGPGGTATAPTPTASGSTGPTVPPKASADSAPPDTLRWSLEGLTNLRGLDPAKSGDAPIVTVISLVFGGLIRLNERLEIQPDAASDWTVSADGTVYTFTIREGLKFADGTPVTAGDFVFSINRALAPETASFGAASALSHIVGAAERASGTAASVSGVRALDRRTLEIRLDGPVAFFLVQLSYPYTFVVPRKLVESGPDWAGSAYGIGPYQVQEWKRGESILLTTNPNYYGGTPGVAKVRFSFNRDSEVALQRYLAGEFDIMGSGQSPLPTNRIAEVQNLPDFKSAAAQATRYVGFNNRRAPFDDVNVRRAFALAIDKQALANTTLAGQVIPADRILPTGLLGTQLPIKPLSFDPAAAKDALARAGFANGQGLPPLTLAYGVEGENPQVAEALVRLWQQHLGVNVTLEPMELGAFSGALEATYKQPEQGLQFYYSIWGADYPDPQNFLSQQLETGTANNNGHWSDTTFDRLVQEADKLGDRGLIDRRLKLYNQAEQIAIDKVGWLPLFYPKFNVLLNPRVEGIVIAPTGFLIPDWTNVRLRS